MITCFVRLFMIGTQYKISGTHAEKRQDDLEIGMNKCTIFHDLLFYYHQKVSGKQTKEINVFMLCISVKEIKKMSK